MRLILLNLFLCISVALLAQTPQAFKYQAVVRDNNGNVLVNKIISIKTSILKTSETGASVYTETQTLSTNDFGVVALNIGSGTLVSGNFTSINWSNDTYFIKTEVDLSGGSNYQFMGTSQLLSVPYALNANTSNKALNDNDTSATNEIQNLSINGQDITISAGNTITLPNTNTDNQQLTLNGNQLSISGGNVINIPPDNDADTTNEIQNLSFSAGTLSLSKSNSVTIPDNQTLSLSGQNLTIANGNTVTIPDNQSLSLNANILTISGGNNVVLPNDSDANPTNEIQALSLQNDTLYLSNGGFVNMAPFKDNTDSQQLSISGNQLQISGGNAVTITNVVDLDADPTNELQYLSRSGDTLYLSQGNYVVMPHDEDADPTNELQKLIQAGDTIRLTKGGGEFLISNNNNGYSPTLDYHGNGVNGTYNSINGDTLFGILNFENFYLKLGDTINIKETVLIRVKDTCIINGVINGKGLSKSNWTNTAGSNGGGGGCYSGVNGFHNGSDGELASLNLGFSNIQRKALGATYSIESDSGRALSSKEIDDLLSSYQVLALHGTKGGKGGTSPSTGCNLPNLGGYGGAGLYLICNVLDFKGKIILSGDDGLPNEDNGNAAGGGGGSGAAIISAHKYLNNTGEIILKGGLPGIKNSFECYFGGGSNFKSAAKGGDGWFKVISH